MSKKPTNAERIAELEAKVNMLQGMVNMLQTQLLLRGAPSLPSELGSFETKTSNTKELRWPI